MTAQHLTMNVANAPAYIQAIRSEPTAEQAAAHLDRLLGAVAQAAASAAVAANEPARRAWEDGELTRFREGVDEAYRLGRSRAKVVTREVAADPGVVVERLVAGLVDAIGRIPQPVVNNVVEPAGVTVLPSPQRPVVARPNRDGSVTLTPEGD